MTFAAIIVHPDGTHTTRTITGRVDLESVVGVSYDYLQVTEEVELIHSDEPSEPLNLFAAYLMEELSGDREHVHGDAVFVGTGEGDFNDLPRFAHELIAELLEEAPSNAGLGMT